MAITQTITTLPDAPNWQSEAPEVAEQKAIDFTQALPAFGEELNELAAEINSAAATIAANATSADASKTAAETAKTAAQSAKTAAETAATGATNAKTAAETAQGIAESAAASVAASNLPAISSADAGKALVVKPDGSGLETKNIMDFSYFRAAPSQFITRQRYKLTDFYPEAIKRLLYFKDALVYLGNDRGAVITYDGKNPIATIGGYIRDCIEFYEADGKPSVLLSTKSRTLKYSRDLINWEDRVIPDPNNQFAPDNTGNDHLGTFGGISPEGILLLGSSVSAYKWQLWEGNIVKIAGGALPYHGSAYMSAQRLRYAASYNDYNSDGSLYRGAFIANYNGKLSLSQDAINWAQTSINSAYALVVAPALGLVIRAGDGAIAVSRDSGLTFTTITMPSDSLHSPQYVPEVGVITLRKNSGADGQEESSWNLTRDGVNFATIYAGCYTNSFTYSPRLGGWVFKAYEPDSPYQYPYFCPA
jgi:hypothetical protein